jgi:hypothetical protein
LSFLLNFLSWAIFFASAASLKVVMGLATQSAVYQTLSQYLSSHFSKALATNPRRSSLAAAWRSKK